MFKLLHNMCYQKIGFYNDYRDNFFIIKLKISIWYFSSFFLFIYWLFPPTTIYFDKTFDQKFIIYKYIFIYSGLKDR